MNLLSILLQVSADSAVTTATAISNQNYFQLLLKGGWILVPLFSLLILATYMIVERWVFINMLGKADANWIADVNKLVANGEIENAIKLCNEKNTTYAKVLVAGLESAEFDDMEIQEAIQSEAKQQISILERGMNYLGITASVAPMLGFLGTIFGVIKIFYNISITNDLNIANISDGLYQKMISSGTGLFVGIIAYSGYYVLNGRIDRIVVRMDKYSNDLLKGIRNNKRAKNA
ncbi:MAG: MotA/TolQ/ExbB proton channel family protein [Paludibacter sp.]|nr:MotA/TolQ/ExbB proton channel family protein [Paludibacter sp.]